jgi:hypothetical protein
VISYATSLGGRAVTGRTRLALTVSFCVVLSGIVVPPARASATDPCAAPTNPVVCENSKPGAPSSEWDVSGAGDDSIQGFATDISVNAGSSVSFKVKTTAAYTVDIYRLGYYQGDGARKVASAAATPRNQPACLQDSTVNLVDCGNWLVSATWAVPASAVSGVYVARFTRNDDGGASLAPFVVRSDASTSAVLMQTSDTTWHAYNEYGGSDFYSGANGRAYKVSYNRPVSTHGDNMLFAYEYAMIRFVEQNGYDVSYTTDLDSDRRGALIKQHKVFLTAGHDEYWSGGQRANVQAARDAGVNLAFFTGNDDYWKTRWEPSIDGSATANRTLVCYKETWDNAKIDPSAAWTGTWRDPRFSPPADGGVPENALGGTAYMSNFTDLAVQVSSAEGKLRLWRNTGLSALAAGSTASLAPHTVGYESNEDLDNGFRPAGLIRLSTSTGAVPQYLRDFGSTVTPGTTTHHLTMYKAASGALVFSAGTIQWTWGLDANHDDTEVTPDSRMQQATVNLLADMNAQPLTLMSGLVAATRTTDTTAPTSTITSPAAGTTIANGSQVTVTGTASDTGGGVVAGIEVSADGGQTWHPADSGTTSWSYTFIATGSGNVSLKSRASDDSGNIETPNAGVGVTMTCPCTLFGAAVPDTPAVGDASDVTLGVRFVANAGGYITGVRFYKGTGNTGTHTGTLWSATGTALATGTFNNETATGWQTLTFSKPVAVTAGTTYVASYRAPSGHYAAAANFFYRGDVVSGPLTAPRMTMSSVNGTGVFSAGAGFPTQSYQATNYYVDAVYQPPGSVGPSVVDKSPTPGSASNPVETTPTVTFDGAVQPATISMTVTGPGTTNVAGTVAYDPATFTATFDPAALLAGSTTFTVQVSGAKNSSGVPMPAPVSWSFTTAPAGGCPCSLFGSTAPTTVDSGDGSAIEVGLRFTPTANGKVTGVRFYKAPGNTGTHTGTLWSAAGAALATGTFSNETDSGWQSLTFASPVSVTAGTAYTVSYYAPSGHYSVTSDFFTSDYVIGALTAPAGANGVYRYGVGGGFPTSSYRSTNYWVDVSYEMTPSPNPPQVTSTVPAAGGTYIPVSTAASATFDIAVQPATIAMTLTGPGGAAVAGTVSYDSLSRTAKFTPSAALAQNTAYTASVSGARSASGVAMTAPVTWSFTTDGPSPGICPCSMFDTSATPGTVDSNDGSAIEVGMRFTPTADGVVTSVRYYKASTNTGTHTGSIWSASGTLLARATFSGESGSGWQTVSFATPVAVTAGTTYVVSYYTPSGHYSVNSDFFTADYLNGPLTAPATGGNGVYRYGSGGGFPTSTYRAANYWMDVVFRSSTPPAVTAKSPAAGATGVGVTSHVSATFADPVQPTSVSLTVTDPGGAAAAGSISYNGTTNTATFIPFSALAAGTTYTATVSGAKSTAGVPMTAPLTWTFTTALAGACPCTLFGPSATPATVDSGDGSAIEVGVRLTPSANGTITGVRFYKASTNTGTHVGTLWSAAGVALATGTFTAESASGWQTLVFASPVPVTAGSTYTASYYAPSGHYSVNSNFFTTDYVNGPLTAPAGTNGVYRYGAGGGLPTNTFGSANYWVDAVFQTAP